MQSKSTNTDIKKSSTPRATDKSAFFNHVGILMKRLLDLEYQIRFFRDSFPEAFAYIKSFREVILDSLRYIKISEETISNLKLVDGVYDYIQMEQLNFSIDFLDEIAIPKQLFKANLDKLTSDFLDGLNDADPIHGWSQKKKDFIFLTARFADISAGNDLDVLLRLYLHAKYNFDFFEKNPNSIDLLKQALYGFHQLRLPVQRAGISSFVNLNKVNIGDFSDDYLTLNVRNYESPEAIPFVLTNFLIEYSTRKIACDAATHENGQPSKKILKEVDAINELIQVIDKQYMTSSSFNKYTTHLPHILGLMQWDIKQTQPKKVKEIIDKKLSDLEQEFKYLGNLTLADDTRSSQLEKTESLIAALKEEWRLTL